MFCLPNSQQQQQQQQLDDEPNAFDLTWRNYLPSTAQLCSCLPAIGYHRQQGILLDDDNHHIDNNTIAYYNDFYQANAVRGYLGNQHDREFDDLLLTNDNTRKHHGGKSKKRSKRKKYPKRRLLREPAQQLPSYYNTDFDDYDDDNPYEYNRIENDDYQQEHQGPIVYEVYSDTEQQDAVYLGDDQIAKMVNRYDQGEGNQAGQHQHCAPRAVPFTINAFDDDNDDDQYQDYNTKGPSLSSPPATSTTTRATTDNYDHDQLAQPTPAASTAALAAQAILSEKLEDLTEKLAFIRNNMMDIGTSSSTAKQHNSDSTNDTQKGDDDDDTATLHTLKTLGKKVSLERLSISSDLDSIASEALLEYENASQQQHIREPSATSATATTTTSSDYHNRRFSSNLVTDLRMPVDLDSPGSSSYTRQSHPFAYFTEHVDDNDEDDNVSSPSDKSTFGLQGAVLNFGRKWFG